MSKEKPISFSPEMVRALMEGRKTVTRRLTKGKPCRFEVGDVLWVREAWAVSDEYDPHPPRDVQLGTFIHYLADGNPMGFKNIGRNRPAMFMPRWMSRTLLRVVSVRAELLHEITEGDAMREGVILRRVDCGRLYPSGSAAKVSRQQSFKEAFVELWSTLHTKPGDRWEDNPAVYRIEFERLTQ